MGDSSLWNAPVQLSFLIQIHLNCGWKYRQGNTSLSDIKGVRCFLRFWCRRGQCPTIVPPCKRRVQRRKESCGLRLPRGRFSFPISAGSVYPLHYFRLNVHSCDNKRIAHQSETKWAAYIRVDSTPITVIVFSGERLLYSLGMGMSCGKPDALFSLTRRLSSK